MLLRWCVVSFKAGVIAFVSLLSTVLMYVCFETASTYTACCDLKVQCNLNHVEITAKLKPAIRKNDAV